jgi:hypothetical protein
VGQGQLRTSRLYNLESAAVEFLPSPKP